MAEPLRDMMLSVAKAKREEIERLQAKLSATEDPDVREGLSLKLAKLRQELEAAERASGGQQSPEPATSLPSPAAPAPQTQPFPAAEPVVPAVPVPAAQPLPLSRAELEERVAAWDREARHAAAEVQAFGDRATPEQRNRLAHAQAQLHAAMLALSMALRADARAAPEEEAPAVPRGPSRAALEAQVRELQVELLELSHTIARAGSNPHKADVERLAEVREKLQEAMGLLGQQAGMPLPEFQGELPPPPTTAQQMEAENLIRQARVAKMRGQAQAATDLLRRAAAAAPGASAVQEALGDELLERGRAKEAAEAYARAWRLKPESASAERKYAEASARAKGALTVDEALRMGFSDSPFAASADAASVKAAKLMSLMLPGLGQLVMGQYQRGALLLVGWLAMVGWVVFMPDGFSSLVRSVFGGGGSFSPLVIVPIVGALAIHVTAVATCGSAASQVGSLRKSAGHRPPPPVDLPFE